MEILGDKLKKQSRRIALFVTIYNIFCPSGRNEGCGGSTIYIWICFEWKVNVRRVPLAGRGSDLEMDLSEWTPHVWLWNFLRCISINIDWARKNAIEKGCQQLCLENVSKLFWLKMTLLGYSTSKTLYFNTNKKNIIYYIWSSKLSTWIYLFRYIGNKIDVSKRQVSNLALEKGTTRFRGCRGHAVELLGNLVLIC